MYSVHLLFRSVKSDKPKGNHARYQQYLNTKSDRIYKDNKKEELL